MKKHIVLASIFFCVQQIFPLKLSDYVAQAVGMDETSDDIKNKALFLTKSLQVNNHPDAKLGYYYLYRSKYFNGDKAAADAALSTIAMSTGVNIEQFKGHQGPQAVEDIITMFVSGPGAAVYKKLAPTNNKMALDTVIKALESTKAMLN